MKMSKREFPPDGLVRAFLASMPGDKAGAYAARGRRFQSISTIDLTNQWVAILYRIADDTTNRELRGAMDDCESELLLRGQEPPYAAHAQAIDTLCNAVAARLASMESIDPGKLADALANDLEKFEQRLSGSS